MVREDDILGRLFDEFDQLSLYGKVYGMVLDAILKTIHTPDFPVEKVTFILKDPVSVRDTYKGILDLNIETVEKPGKKEAESKKEKEKEKEKTTTIKGGKSQVVKITFESEFLDKTVVIPTILEKSMIIFKNNPFEYMVRSNMLECIYLLAKIENEEETKEDIRKKIEEFCNNIEDACIRKLQAIDNLDVFSYDVSPN